MSFKVMLQHWTMLCPDDDNLNDNLNSYCHGVFKRSPPKAEWLKRLLPGDFAMPVYHIETRHPFIRPACLIWQCYGNFTGKLQYFSECCNFPENDHIWSEGAIVHGGGGLICIFSSRNITFLCCSSLCFRENWGAPLLILLKVVNMEELSLFRSIYGFKL